MKWQDIVIDPVNICIIIKKWKEYNQLKGEAKEGVSRDPSWGKLFNLIAFLPYMYNYVLI